MSFNQRDQTILSDIRKARGIHPDLHELLDFYEKLFLAQFAFKSRLNASGKLEPLAIREIHPSSLSDGLRQVSFRELEFSTAPFPDLYSEVSQLLIPYVGSAEGLETEPVPEKIIEWAREIFEGRDPLIAPGSPGGLARTAAGFVLAPYLQLACDLILPRVSLNMWHREYCPICGGLPAFAALISETDPRTLFCPRCHGEWTFGRVGCPFCKSGGPQTYYADGGGRYRLYVCETCNRYLKTVDTRQKGMDWCLPVECLITVSMDIAAREKGFAF